ncbi:MAG: hypothetical protein L3K02_06525 [Thermoplasmata archaeon]|nr:hypothetical protein [Thermoplasmata archaeon]
MASYNSAELTAIVIQLIIVLVIVRRSYLMTQGVPYSLSRLAITPVLILFLWAVTELESTFLTPWAIPYLIALDLAVVVLSSIALIPVAERMTQMYRGPSGEWWYRIGFSLAALFIGTFVIRFAITVLLFPGALEYGSSPGGYPSVSEQFVLVMVDALFSLSAGLLVARSIGIRRKRELVRANGATAIAR